MPYMLLIVEPPDQRFTRTEPEGREVYAQMLRFGLDLKDRGLLIAGESLQSQARAARVQVRNGHSQIVDGPFVEAKEMVGGFFLLDCDSREEAIAIAAQCRLPRGARWRSARLRLATRMRSEALVPRSGGFPRPANC